MRELLQWYNQQHLDPRSDDTDLAARISSYELAFKMQMAAPELADLSKETAATQALYGMNEERHGGVRRQVPDGAAAGRARRSLRPIVVGVNNRRRRLGRPRAVRQGHRQHGAARWTSQSPDCLLTWKSRGLLDSTLVVWGGEFGRTPTSDGSANGGGDSQGRDHNPYGFTMWMAGGGVRGGKVIGSTDEIGLRAVE